MTLRKVFIGSVGPFLYDDWDLYSDPDFVGDPQEAVVTDGDIKADRVIADEGRTSSRRVVTSIITIPGVPNGVRIVYALLVFYKGILIDVQYDGYSDVDLSNLSSLNVDILYIGAGTGTSLQNGNSGDLDIYTPANKTLELQTPVYEDIRIDPGSFDRPGSSDPSIVSVQPGGSGTATYLYEFAKNNIASFTVQLPHSYKVGEDIKVHIHWTPGGRGTAESGNNVGWKIDYTWASVNGNFGTINTLDLSDACDGTDWKHQMTSDVSITGAGKGISSMLLCNIKRTDTGTDDTWSSGTPGQQPLLLEIDFHFPIDTMGSRDWGTK